MNDLIITDRIHESTHSLKDEWLLSRLVPWMFNESEGNPWYACALLSDGRFKVFTHDGLTLPPLDKQRFTQRVCRHLNKHANFGGAWLCGWIDEARFYMLWRDRDGDIQVPIEVDRGWLLIRDWPMETWEQHAVNAHTAWADWHRNMDYGSRQQIKIAQGERSH